MERRTIRRAVGGSLAIAIGSFIFANAKASPQMSPSGDVIASIDTKVDDIVVRYQFTDDGKRFGSFNSPTLTNNSIDATVDRCEGTTLVHESEERTQFTIEDKSVHYDTTRTLGAAVCKDGQITPADFS